MNMLLNGRRNQLTKSFALNKQLFRILGLLNIQNVLTGVSRNLRILGKFTTAEYIIEDTAGKTNIGRTRIALVSQA
jgi:hypothetical protein